MADRWKLIVAPAWLTVLDISGDHPQFVFTVPREGGLAEQLQDLVDCANVYYIRQDGSR